MAKKFNWKMFAVWVLVLSGVGLLLWWAFLPQADTTGFQGDFTVKLTNYKTLVDQSNVTEVSYWGPKLGAVFDTADDYRDSANYEVKLKAIASTIKLTPAQFQQGWIEINPDGDYDQLNNTFFRVEKCDAYEFKCYNLSTDVKINMLATSTLKNDTVTAENKTIVMNAPLLKTTGLLSFERQLCCQAPLYDLEADTLHLVDYSDIFSQYTSFFAIKFNFVNSTSASTINITVLPANAQSWQMVRSGSNIYLVAKEPFTFPARGTLDIEVEMEIWSGWNEMNSITTERISVPGDVSTLADGTTYSSVADA